MLHAYFDQELDPVRSLEVERHLKDCPACQRRYEEQQALRKVVAGQSLRFEAPPALYRSVRNAVREAGGAGEPRRRGWDLSWLRRRVLMPAAVVALVLLAASPWITQPSAQTRLAGEVVSAHVRALMTDHLTDVTSTDQHTVKPWFNGKVTFSPPVVDPSAQGFPLIGGRLDLLEEQPVAALVYQHRKHFINLFIWPSNGSGGAREKTLTQRGYNLVHWAEGGMDFWAVSDMNAADLQEFTRLVRNQPPPPGGK